MKSELRAADLFCGAGGTSHGAERSKEAKLVFALNHWQRAIDTHSANFPHAQHVNSRLSDTHPGDCRSKIDILFASPECTHHSNARGGRPMQDQSRSGARDVLKWVRFHKPGWVVIENVREFENWGPLTDQMRPDPTRKGEYFREFLTSLRRLGYTVEFQLLNAADFGAATSRVRLIIIARRGKKSPVFPEPTHSKNPTRDLFSKALPPWRAAAEVIDWNLPCPSIFTRKRPLADKTLRRIELGLRKFVGPFVGQFQGPGMGDPSYKGVFDPTRPIPTILARNNHGLVIPYQVQFRNNCDAASIGEPIGTITAGGTHHGMAVPFIAQWDQTGFGAPGVRSVADPHYTIVTKQNSGLCIPFLLQRQGFYDCQKDKTPKGVEGPLPVITASHKPGHLVVPYMIDTAHGDDTRTGIRVYPLSDPMGTATTSRSRSLIVPFIASYYGNAQFSGVDQPVHTIPTKDRHCLIYPELAPHVPDWRAIQEWENEGGSCGEPYSDAMISLLETMAELGVSDIGFRMFVNSELALAQGFDRSYRFYGNNSEVTKQIGNSVAPDKAEAITRAIAAA